MTPKEKALKLCQDFAWTTVGEDANEGFSLPIDVAKKCALISVDEILEVSKSYAGKDYEYFQEVKKEIEKL